MPVHGQRLLLIMTLCSAACGTTHGLDSGGDGLDGGVDAGTPPEDAGGAIDAGETLDAGPEDAGSEQALAYREFCTEMGLARCAGRQACCMWDFRRGGPCDREAIEEHCAMLADDPLLSSGAVVFDPDEAERALSEVTAAMPSCAAIDRGWTIRSVLHGTLELGADCTPTTPQSLGRFACHAGLRCEMSGTRTEFTGRCAELGQVGDSCNYDCADGLFCLSELEPLPFAGYCQAQDDSTGCRTDYACSSLWCVIDSCETPSPADTWCQLIL